MPDSPLKERVSHEQVSAMGFAWVNRALDEMDQAFSWLNKAAEERSPHMLSIKGPCYENLHADLQYEMLRKKMGLPTDCTWMKYGNM